MAGPGLGGDDREFTKPDVLFDASVNKLYVATRDGSATKQNRPYRYSFDGFAVTLDDSMPGDNRFPVNISGGGEETLTIAKDSTGKLWIAYTVGSKVKANRSTTDDATWGTPFTLPVAGASNVKGDDIAAGQAFDGRVGVLWSNQNDQKDYFAYHPDGAADTTGWSVEVAYSGSSAADDHVNMKTGLDGSVWAAVKTSKNEAAGSAAEPLIVLLHRPLEGGWSASEVWKVADQATRPICLLDQAEPVVDHGPGRDRLDGRLGQLLARQDDSRPAIRWACLLGWGQATPPANAVIAGTSGIVNADRS